MTNKPYIPTSAIVNLSFEIGELIGVVNASHLRKPSDSIRKTNRIRSIQSTLAISGNPFSLNQINDIVGDESVRASDEEALSVKNAIAVYNELSHLDAYFINDFLKTHSLLMDDLISDAGAYRSGRLAIFKDDEERHKAPPIWNVPNLVSELFIYLNRRANHPIIKSCVFHYELAYIQPFSDGNGRMARIWQKRILMSVNPVFEFIPLELEIEKNKQTYYDALADSDKAGHCTAFVEFMLQRIKDGLQKLVNTQRSPLSDTDRILYFKEQSGLPEFTRKDYLRMFKHISIATASRDMKKGVDEGMWRKIGDGRTSRYVTT